MAKPTASLALLRKKGSVKYHKLQAPDYTQYFWHPAAKIGKGSFGEVFKGWEEKPNSHGIHPEVAIKMIKKEFIDQDPKVRENLDREIDIMKQLSDCVYAVKLHNVMDTKDQIVLAMELCDCDLDQFVKDKAFGENNVKSFLFQMAEGMKVLQNQHIVHRDLKPSNILIKSTSRDNFAIKLADFGFARNFTANQDLTSLAGTPVFMAPEALRCIFYRGKKYDEKVDLWSIGALLYKVIVGQCGFYANLQDILTILEKKADGIAHVRSSGVNFPKYIMELPDEVDKRLSPFFKKKVEELLVKLLKLEPSERMTFPEFFDFIDDLVKSKLTIISIHDGEMCKIAFDNQMSYDQLSLEIQGPLRVPPRHQLLVHQVNDNQHPINLSSLEQQHFRQHIISLKPDQERPIYLMSLNPAGVDRRAGDVIKLLEQARDYPVQGLKMIKDQRLVEKLLQSLHAHPASLESSFHRQIAGIRLLWEFINSQHDGVMLQRVDFSVGQAESACDMMVDQLQKHMEYFDMFVGQDFIDKCRAEKEIIEKLQEELSNKYERLQLLLDNCQKVQSVELSPMLISRNVTKLVTSIKKLPKASVAEIQDRLIEVYEQFAELNDVVEQSVALAIRELQGTYENIAKVQNAYDDLTTFCHGIQSKVVKSKENENKLFELLQQKLKEPVAVSMSVEPSGRSDDSYQDMSVSGYPSDMSSSAENMFGDEESTLVASRLRSDDPLLSFDYVSMPQPHCHSDQPQEVPSHSQSHVVIDPDKIGIGDLVLFLPTPHEGQVFVAHTKSHFIFLDKSCLSEFGLSPNKSASNTIVGKVVSLPECHQFIDSSSPAFKLNPNVKSYYTIKCEKPSDVTIKGRPSPKMGRKKVKN